jgi:hypothetical protein
VEVIIQTIAAGRPPDRPVPQVAIDQARLTAKNGVPLTVVLCRYHAGSVVTKRIVGTEIKRDDGLTDRQRLAVSESISQALDALLELLMRAIGDEYQRELESVTGSREQRRAELVRALLSGADVNSEALGYELDATHLGLIATGAGAEEAIRRLAGVLDRELLMVSSGEQTVEAWLGGRGPIPADGLSRPLSDGAFSSVCLALGDWAKGRRGFRLTHSQAHAAREIARRTGRLITRYTDAPLVALVLGDEAMTRWLIDTYLRPLDQSRGDKAMLRKTLLVYLGCEYNKASAASALQIAASTMKERLAMIERLLGFPIGKHHLELEIALKLEALLAQQPRDSLNER